MRFKSPRKDSTWITTTTTNNTYITSARENISPFAFLEVISERTIDVVGEVCLKELLQGVGVGDEENGVEALEVSEDRPKLPHPIEEYLFNFVGRMDGWMDGWMDGRRDGIIEWWNDGPMVCR